MFELDDLFQFAINQDIEPPFQNEDEAFQYVWNRTSYVRSVPEFWMKVKKEDGAGEDLKILGNNCYSSKNYERAEVCYLKALTREKYNGVTHGQILSNLSILRYIKEKYHQCIELINMCEKTEYPKNNFPKLYIRKMRAWKKLGDDQNALQTFRHLKKLLRALKLNESEKNKILGEASEVLKELPNKKIKNECDEELIVPEMEKNLTSKAEMRKGGVRGTIVQATENIKQGEPILVEPMHFTNFINFCSNCYSTNKVPHSCESCAFVLYCSEDCKKADADMHKLHCTIYQTRPFCEVAEYVYEPLVIFTKGRTSNAFHDFKAFSKDPKTFLNALVGCCIVVHHIMENRQFLKRLVDKNIVVSGLDTKRTALEIGKKLLELAVIWKFNREPCLNGGSRACCFFPQFITFGHSCSPNTSKYFSGNKIVVKASEDIEAGQEISVAYGSLLYTYIDRAKRQEELQTNYGFTCQCKACQNLYFAAELTGLIKCERCGFYMCFEPGTFIFCENCSSAKRLDSEMREIPFLLSLNGGISSDKQELIKTIERFKELDFNPCNKIVVVTHLGLALKDIDQGDVENAMKIVVRSNALKGPFNKYIYWFHLIFRSLQAQLRNLHSSANRHRITEKISIETVDNIEKFVNTFESLIDLYYPKRQIFKGIEEVRKYLSIITQIYTIYSEADKLDWNIVDEDNDLPFTCVHFS